MCEHYKPCKSKRAKPKIKPKVFSCLLLDCWQREYDKRPYRNFVFKQLEFEKRMERNFHPIKDFAIIVEFIQSHKLDSVTIIGVNATTKLALEIDFAGSLLNLRKLELRMMQLPENLFDQLVCNVSKMHLRELILEGSKLTYIKLVDLRLFLIESKTLQYLNVASCNIDQHNFAIVADGVHKSTSMRRFHFNRIVGRGLTLDSHKISHTVSSLIWQNKLEELEMKQCELIAQDMEIIAEYIWSPCSRLRKLDVGCNLIASDGAEYLLRAIANSGTLTELNLSSCSLGSHGGDVVAKYLSSCFFLEFLNLTYNDIGAESINSILTMLKKRIKELNIKLWGNQFDVKSGRILNRLLKARVMPQECIDITVTYEEDLEYFRIVPYY